MGSGDDHPHLIRLELSTRLVGGIEGACDQCERPRETTDGLPRAVGDRFVLRHKVDALLALGKGESYRQSAWNARRLRENHLAHAGSPPPRRRHDGAGLKL